MGSVGAELLLPLAAVRICVSHAAHPDVLTVVLYDLRLKVDLVLLATAAAAIVEFTVRFVCVRVCSGRSGE
jgi:hypothetical protein